VTEIDEEIVALKTLYTTLRLFLPDDRERMLQYVTERIDTEQSERAKAAKSQATSEGKL
jgi:hypothetical protein